MRTTITLEDELMALLAKHMSEHGLSFKEAVNGLLRSALTGKGAARPDVVFPSVAMGQPSVGLTHALRLAHELEDEERERELGVGR